MITCIPHRNPKNDAAPTNVFPLVKLPLEIRQRIYHFHFHQPKKLDVFEGECPAWVPCPLADYSDFLPVQELILASKLIYHEAMPIYYRIKTLTFESIESLWRFLRVIGPVQRSYVAYICFNLRGTRESYEFRLLADCPRLQTLEIIFDNFHPSRLSVGHLFQVRGLKSVELTGLPNREHVYLDDFEAPLQVLMLPYDSAVTPLGPARAFALRDTPRIYFGANEPTKRARSAPSGGNEDNEFEKTETVLTKARKGHEDDQIQTVTKKIQTEGQV